MLLSPSQGLRRQCLCGRLLAVQHGDAFHLRYRELDALVRGELRVRCTRCRSVSVLTGERARP
jgi:hypothetical protein